MERGGRWWLVVCFAVVALVAALWQPAEYSIHEVDYNSTSEMANWNDWIGKVKQKLPMLSSLGYFDHWFEKKLENEVLIKWSGPFCGSGGYATESRAQYLALASYLSSVNYTTNLVSPTNNSLITVHWKLEAQHMGPSRLELDEVCIELPSISVAPTSDPIASFHILHTTPPYWPNSQGDYRIGRTMYETNSVPHGWLQALHTLDELWLPSKFNVHSFKQFLQQFNNPYSPPIPPCCIIEEGTNTL